MRKIEDIRYAKGFDSAGDFAKYIGMASSNYSQIATGKKHITRRMIAKLEKVFPGEKFDDLQQPVPLSKWKNEQVMVVIAAIEAELKLLKSLLE